MALTDAQREAIYRLARREQNYVRFFRYLSELKLNMRQSSVAVVEDHSGLNHKNSLDLMRQIAETGVAEMHSGGGEPSYLMWRDDVDIREVGKSADKPLR
ncbi:hypothetical protein [Terricaulis silvestris]|uniref:Uncharacterized protein n=1 Tax=Terricaulis silvestris TaxID=2686094 RepID=A0A6I6MLK9_9CAUL|nr:hypothetical protein [Terricaulis silvestris]QGZ94096.1 hypothetical protein DSM104635_00912 [Terricaulis silvestris]